MQLTRNNATWLVIFCFLGVSQALPVYGAADSLSLDQAVSEAVSTNPDLAAIQARARAMADIPAQKGALPDPTLSAAIANLPMDTFSTTQEPMTQMIIGLSQKLPFPGKLALQQQAAEFEGQAAGADVQEKRLQLVQDVKTVWWNLFYLDRALETVERNQELMRQFITITQTKYQVGNGLQQDVLLAQLELSKLFDLELAFNNTRQNEQSKMNALLDRPASQAINLSPAVDKNLGQPALFATLQNRAVNSRPLLISQQKRLEASGASGLGGKGLLSGFYGGGKLWLSGW
jgi:outer membrane protein TolC